jgi:hypothetical protein
VPSFFEQNPTVMSPRCNSHSNQFAYPFKNNAAPQTHAGANNGVGSGLLALSQYNKRHVVVKTVSVPQQHEPWQAQPPYQQPQPERPQNINASPIISSARVPYSVQQHTNKVKSPLQNFENHMFSKGLTMTAR